MTFWVGALIVGTTFGCVSEMDPLFLSYADCSISIAPDPIFADGSSSELQVSLRYSKRLPAAGIEVTLLTDDAPVTVQQASVVTDALGLARFDVQANEPGAVTFGVQVSHRGRSFELPLTAQVPVMDLLVPRVPPRNPNVSLYGQITGLAFGTVVAVEVNHTILPPMGRNGVVMLLGNVPKGTLYDVAIPSNPRGQSCSIAPRHGAVGPNTPRVQIHCALSVVTANDVNDTVVLGQTDDASSLSQSPPDAATLLQPWGKAFTSAEGITFVADRSNQRVLGYYPEPISGSAATLVLGQNDDFTANAPRAATQGFNRPSAVGGGNNVLLVADTNNNRIVIYEPTPFGQVDPTIVLGQTNLATNSAGCGSAALNHPNQAVAAGNMLLVADTSNHRVLVWSFWPTATGTPADLVLGQASFTTCLPNQGSGLALASSLSAPQDVWADENYLAVADFGNRRVLIWAQLPVLTGQAADIAVGQADLNSSGAQATSATSLNGPVSVVFDHNTLFVADAQDHRVVAFNPFPAVSGPGASYVLGQYLSTDNTCNQGHGATPFTLCNPTGVSFVGGDLAVTDSNNNRMLIFYSNP